MPRSACAESSASGSKSAGMEIAHNNLLTHVNNIRKCCDWSSLQEGIAATGDEFISQSIAKATQYLAESRRVNSLTSSPTKMAGDMLKTPSRKRTGTRTRGAAALAALRLQSANSSDPFGSSAVNPSDKENNPFMSSSTTGVGRATRSKADKSQLVRPVSFFEAQVAIAQEKAKARQEKQAKRQKEKEEAEAAAAAETQAAANADEVKTKVETEALDQARVDEEADLDERKAKSKAQEQSEAQTAGTLNPSKSASSKRTRKQKEIPEDSAEESMEVERSMISIDKHQGATVPRASTPPPPSPVKADADRRDERPSIEELPPIEEHSHPTDATQIVEHAGMEQEEEQVGSTTAAEIEPAVSPSGDRGESDEATDVREDESGGESKAAESRTDPKSSGAKVDVDVDPPAPQSEPSRPPALSASKPAKRTLSSHESKKSIAPSDPSLVQAMPATTPAARTQYRSTFLNKSLRKNNYELQSKIQQQEEDDEREGETASAKVIEGQVSSFASKLFAKTMAQSNASKDAETLKANTLANGQVISSSSAPSSSSAAGRPKPKSGTKRKSEEGPEMVTHHDPADRSSPPPAKSQRSASQLGASKSHASSSVESSKKTQSFMLAEMHSKIKTLKDKNGKFSKRTDLSNMPLSDPAHAVSGSNKPPPAAAATSSSPSAAFPVASEAESDNAAASALATAANGKPDTSKPAQIEKLYPALPNTSDADGIANQKDADKDENERESSIPVTAPSSPRTIPAADRPGLSKRGSVNDLVEEWEGKTNLSTPQRSTKPSGIPTRSTTPINSPAPRSTPLRRPLAPTREVGADKSEEEEKDDTDDDVPLDQLAVSKTSSQILALSETQTQTQTPGSTQYYDAVSQREGTQPRAEEEGKGEEDQEEGTKKDQGEDADSEGEMTLEELSTNRIKVSTQDATAARSLSRPAPISTSSTPSSHSRTGSGPASPQKSPSKTASTRIPASAISKAPSAPNGKPMQSSMSKATLSIKLGSSKQAQSTVWSSSHSGQQQASSSSAASISSPMGKSDPAAPSPQVTTAASGGWGARFKTLLGLQQPSPTNPPPSASTSSTGGGFQPKRTMNQSQSQLASSQAGGAPPQTTPASSSSQDPRTNSIQPQGQANLSQSQSTGGKPASLARAEQLRRKEAEEAERKLKEKEERKKLVMANKKARADAVLEEEREKDKKKRLRDGNASASLYPKIKVPPPSSQIDGDGIGGVAGKKRKVTLEAESSSVQSHKQQQQQQQQRVAAAPKPHTTATNPGAKLNRSVSQSTNRIGPNCGVSNNNNNSSSSSNNAARPAPPQSSTNLRMVANQPPNGGFNPSNSQIRFGPGAGGTLSNHANNNQTTTTTLHMAKQAQLNAQAQAQIQAQAQAQFSMPQQQQQKMNGGGGCGGGTGFSSQNPFQQSKANHTNTTQQQQQQQQQVEREVESGEEEVLPDVYSEYSDSEDEETIERRLARPEWTQGAQLEAALHAQATVDADAIFGIPQGPVCLDELLPNVPHSRRGRPRSSSANWSGPDGLAQWEVDRYNRRLGIRGAGVLLLSNNQPPSSSNPAAPGAPAARVTNPPPPRRSVMSNFAPTQGQQHQQ